MGRVFGGIVGQSKANLRSVIQTAEAIAPMTNTVLLAQLMDGQIAALRHWAKGRAREAASRTKPARNGRRMAETN